MRVATLNDAEWVLTLRNDPEVRGWSRSSEVMTPEAHTPWFLSHKSELWVSPPVGYVRVEPSGRVSLVVAPLFRGVGIGADLLRQAIEVTGKGRYAAWVRQDHARSLTTFIRCGFCPVGIDGRWVDLEWIRCPHCRAGVPFHSVGRRSIGDEDRMTIPDLHELSDASGVGLAECLG